MPDNACSAAVNKGKAARRIVVYIDPEGIEDTGELERWIGEALAFAMTLPPK